MVEASALIPLENAPRLRGDLLRLFQTAAIVRGTPFARTIRDRWAGWEKLPNKDLDARLKAINDEIKTLLDRQAELQKVEPALDPGGRSPATRPRPAARPGQLRALPANL